MPSTEKKLDTKGGSITIHTFDGKGGEDNAKNFVYWTEKNKAAMDGRDDKYGTINEKDTGEKIKAVLEKKEKKQTLTADEEKIDDWNTNGIRFLTYALEGDAYEIKREHEDNNYHEIMVHLKESYNPEDELQVDAAIEERDEIKFKHTKEAPDTVVRRLVMANRKVKKCNSKQEWDEIQLIYRYLNILPKKDVKYYDELDEKIRDTGVSTQKLEDVQPEACMEMSMLH